MGVAEVDAQASAAAGGDAEEVVRRGPCRIDRRGTGTVAAAGDDVDVGVGELVDEAVDEPGPPAAEQPATPRLADDEVAHPEPVGGGDRGRGDVGGAALDEAAAELLGERAPWL